MLSCPTLFNPFDDSPPGSSVHGILQARILEWIAILFFRGSSQPRDGTCVSCIASRFFTIWAIREAQMLYTSPLSDSEVTQSCLTLCDPMDCSPPASSGHGILQARILEQVAISYSRGSSRPRDLIWVSCIGRRILYHWAIREAHVGLEVFKGMFAYLGCLFFYKEYKLIA